MSKINDKEAFISELRRLEDVYREYTGKEIAKFYRPPEGSFNEKNLEFADEMGYKTVFWSFAYADWDNNKQPECERALDKILSHTHNGEIMLLHPTSSTNAEILDSVITQLKAQGYRLGQLEELCKS
jgi:peptidoglycan-N-acetylmuramic acid deacetylase